MAVRDEDLRRIIDEGMRAAVPDAAARSRMLAGIVARLPPAAAPGPGDGPAPLGTAAAVTSGGAMKLVVAAVVGVAAIGAIAILRQGPTGDASTRAPADAKATADPSAAASQPVAIPEPTTIPAHGPSPQPLPPRPERADATPGVPPTRRASAVGSPGVPSPAAAPDLASPAAAPDLAAPDLAAEAELLAQARAALDAGDPDGALRLTARHAAEHPAGQLAIERDAVAVLAACAGRRPTAGQGARRFLDAHPRQAAAASVRSRCADALAGEKDEGR
jgi:hypothetical protein